MTSNPTSRTDGHAPPSDDGAQVVSLLDEDDELRDAVPEEDRPKARRATAVRVVELGTGPVDESLTERAPLGTMVLSGAVMREVHLGRHCLPELLGPGQTVEPPDATVVTTPRTSEGLVVLEPARLGLLPTSLLLAQARWPSLAVVLRRRQQRRHHRLALYGLICQLPRVEDRLLSLFWHLAEDWGTVTADGVVLPFSFTHETLGAWTGTRRPTVTLGLGVLREEGLVDRTDDGGWRLDPAGRELFGGRPPDGDAVLHRAARAQEDAALLRKPAEATRAESKDTREGSAKLRAQLGADGQTPSTSPKTSE